LDGPPSIHKEADLHARRADALEFLLCAFSCHDRLPGTVSVLAHDAKPQFCSEGHSQSSDYNITASLFLCCWWKGKFLELQKRHIRELAHQRHEVILTRRIVHQ